MIWRIIFFHIRKLTLLEPIKKPIENVLTIANHIYKSSYYACRSEIFYDYIKPYIKTIEANSKTLKQIGIDKTIKIGEEVFEVKINEGIVDNVLIYRPLFFDSNINYYLNKEGLLRI